MEFKLINTLRIKSDINDINNINNINTSININKNGKIISNHKKTIEYDENTKTLDIILNGNNYYNIKNMFNFIITKMYNKICKKVLSLYSIINKNKCNKNKFKFNIDNLITYNNIKLLIASELFSNNTRILSAEDSKIKINGEKHINYITIDTFDNSQVSTNCFVHKFVGQSIENSSIVIKYVNIMEYTVNGNFINSP